MGRDRGLGYAAAVLLLAIACAVAFFAVERPGLEAAIADTQRSLEFNRQRESKQQYEYDKAAGELPQAQAELAALQPQAEAAQAEGTALRAERKQLRAEIASLRGAYNEAEANRAETWAALADAADAAIAAQDMADRALREAEPAEAPADSREEAARR
ncbi:MAG: hypothetical protein IKP40_03560 [Clostridia bacterium]|nr:hypothetical protein [Clostridia bacterium]